jgi:predicted ribosomally synthesized peptide with nif11-like leader
MTSENFERFVALVLSESALREKLRSIDDKKAFIARTVEVGAAEGFDFTGEDVEAAMREKKRIWIERWI